MKSFFKLEECDFDPDIALGILDGIPIQIESKERAKLPSLPALLSLSETAGQVLELSQAAELLGCTQACILRVDGVDVTWGPISGEFYELFDERDVQLIKIAAPDSKRGVPGLLEQLVLCINHLAFPSERKALQVVAYMVTARELGLPSDVSQWLLNEDASDTFIAPFVSVDEALRFARIVARDCPSYQTLRPFLDHLTTWLTPRLENPKKAPRLTQDLMLDDPFSMWRRMPAKCAD